MSSSSNERKKRGVPRPIIHREPRVEVQSRPPLEERDPAPEPANPDKLPTVGFRAWEDSSRRCPNCGSLRRPRCYGGNGPLYLYGCTSCCRRYRVWKGEGEVPK